MSKIASIWPAELIREFSEELRKILEIGHDNIQVNEGRPEGLTTARIFLASMFFGRRQSPSGHPLHQLSEIIGDEEIKLMERRFVEFGFSLPEIEELATQTSPRASSCCHQLLEISVESRSHSRNQIGPLDVLVTLLEQLPREISGEKNGYDCMELLERDRFFPAELYRWLRALSESTEEFPRDLGNRLREYAPPDLRNIGRSRDDQLDMPNLVGLWQAELKRSFNAQFDARVAQVFLEAVNEASSGRGSQENPLLLNTLDFFEPLMKEGRPLGGLQIESFAGAFPSQVPWDEARSTVQIGDFCELTEDTDDCIRGAINILQRTTPNGPVGQWHLAHALLLLKPKGFSWALRSRGSSYEEAKSLLVLNMQREAPGTLREWDQSKFPDLPQRPNEKPSEAEYQKTSTGIESPNPSIGAATDDNVEDVSETAPTSPLAPGTVSEFHRNTPPDQLGGSTEDYANAISRALESDGTDDFSFGLFGSWGRGKTTLMDRVVSKLPDTTAVVRFNAWKYPTRPQVWVHLYEKIRKQATEGSLLHRGRLSLQCNLLRDGGMPLLASGFLLLFSVIPKGAIVAHTIPISGLSSLIALATILLYALRLWHGAGLEIMQYFRLPRHDRHLGLQAVVGDDLKRLLTTWATGPSDEDQQPPALRFIRDRLNQHKGFSGGMSLIWLSLGTLVYRFHLEMHWALFSAIALVSLASIVAFFVFLARPETTQRVLLIVDDLDRCPSTEMLAVIESLRMFLDDEDISARLRVTMLTDREILSHAIAEKYSNLLEATSGYKKPQACQEFSPDSIVDEQMEKYFLLTFDLPPLEFEEMWKIGGTILGIDAETEGGAPDPTTTSEAASEGDSQSRAHEEHPLDKTPTGSGGVSAPAESAPPSGSIDLPPGDGRAAERPSLVRAEAADKEGETAEDDGDPADLKDWEKEAIRKVYSAQFSANQKRPPTPRQMRMTKMRYFLAREIVKELKLEQPARKVIEHFDPISFARSSDPQLAAVVHMVTGRDQTRRPTPTLQND